MALGQAAAQRARVAFQRFGLGPKPGGPAGIAASPINALKAELANPAAHLLTSSRLPTYIGACRAGQNGFTVAQKVLEAELRARWNKAMSPTVGFVERLVHFWSNHFSTSVNKSETIRATVGQLERDVIRHHVLGKFPDMVLGVMQHPAMIGYLDNEDSIGPRSPIGIAWGAGYNENLAREAMELHTVGSDGGYTETDVSNLARIITGWSYVRGWEADHGWNGGTPQNRGQFIYRDTWHEPGRIKLMGKIYPAAGIDQGRAAFTDLALHPKTAEHLAFKMILHFVTDEPTPAMVAPLSQAFLASGGDLKAMAMALLDLPAAWSTPLDKLRRPYELWIAQFRAVGAPPVPIADTWKIREPLRELHNLPFERGPPDGYADETPAWLEPNAMRIRLDTSLLFSRYFTAEVVQTPLEQAVALFDDALSAASRAAIVGAADREQALAIMTMSPEFQRR